MYSNNQSKTKIGKVSIRLKENNYRLRWTYPQGKRHEISIAQNDEEGWSEATRVAKMINRDIALDDLDLTYARYSYRYRHKVEIASQEPSLKQLWQNYQKIKRHTTQESTQKKEWERLNVLFDQLPSNCFSLSKPETFIDECLKRYAPGTLDPRFRILYAAVNMAVKQKRIIKNPYLDLYNPYERKQRTTIECYEVDEVKAIIAAFYSNDFMPDGSRYSHSYYALIVDFLSQTGCRPSEAHALTWSDIQRKSHRTWISFDKAYTEGILKDTKTHETRLFPCNESLIKLIDAIPVIENKQNLIFPSVQGGYIKQNNFRNRYWKVVVDKLIAQGKVHKYLKPYSLRHSFITRLVQSGVVDIKTIADISGNTVDTITQYYLASRRNIELPDF
jgi:integrase